MSIFDWRRAALASLVAMSLVGLATTPALAGEKPTPISDDLPDGAKLIIAQAPLVDLAQAVSEVDPERANLGGIQLEVERRAVHIYWKGDVPDDVYRLVEQARGNGIDATIEEARYAGVEMTKAQTEVMDKRDAYRGLTSVGPMPDGSGLRVGARDPEALRSETFPLEVTVVQEDEIVPTAGRQDDTRPFWTGGAARRGSAFCSTGFAVAHYTWWGAEIDRGLLTAEHCAPGGNATYLTGSFKPLGTSGPSGPSFLAPFSDTQFIKTSSAPRAFTGGTSSTGSRAVAGWTPVWPGMVVCTSGASTGEHCTNLVYAVGVFAITGSGLVLGMDYAFDFSGGAASGTGDSGGPVYTLAWWDPTRKVLAAGMIDNGLFGVTCPPGSRTTACFRNVGFVDIHYALLAQNAGLLISP
ncbi:hypothetical protein [Rhizocola hellebori]|nr:hypothetical protein [Rhizocola hellebori]